MKHKKWMTLVGLTLISHLTLVACQQEQTTSHYKPNIQQTQKDENIYVVAEITEGGYISIHGDHNHLEKGFIPYHAKFLAETLVPKDYAFKEKDLQYKVANGAIVKVNGKYYFYPKTKNQGIVTLDEARQLTKNNKEDHHHGHNHEHDHKKTNKKEVAGIDRPTSDGFLFTSESQIKTKTELGLIVSHGDHEHFIFYNDLKGSKWEYLIPNNANLTAPVTSNAAPTNHSLHDNYVFNINDVVAEDANGYTVRHGDHYHYILKSSLPTQPSQPRQYVPMPLPSNPSSKNHIPGITHPTSDGFLFDGSGVVGHSELGLLVQHGDHTHILRYDDLSKTKWAHLIPNKTPKPQSQTTPSDKQEGPSVDDVAAKRSHLAHSLGLPEETITLFYSDNGPAFRYPHGDHDHIIYLTDIDLNKPIEDPHAHAHDSDKVGMQTLKEMGFDEDIIHDILHANADEPFPSNETNPEKMKEWLKTVRYLNIGERPNPLKRFGLNLMPNVEVLGLGFTTIDDISPVFQFKQLKQLWLTKTGIKNYAFLKNIPQLEGIDFSQNGISDLTFLKDYPNLKVVSAAGNDITDISILANLNNLESLNLDLNNIADLSALSHLQHLKAVSLDSNQITNLSALSNKPLLERLFISHNKGLNLKTLKASALKELTATDNDTHQLDFLDNLPSLETLNLDNNSLTSLEGLEEARALKNLSVSNNNITTLSLSHPQGTLKELTINKNKLNDLEGINNLTVLDSIYASQNKIKTLALAEKNNTLTYIDVSNNHIPAEELQLQDDIPKAIREHFPAVTGGKIEENKPEVPSKTQSVSEESPTNTVEKDTKKPDQVDQTESTTQEITKYQENATDATVESQ
ncbi:pneumococcal-type histidine triad protein [Streptococcus sp. S784/96/1]|uniref:pneumococcal-type histidine triad protein n=1 Tax=Streptococcus sp. S784/96/1 TaxID=2653499 RepID=UPI00138A37D6|nr:pneumococcal-type histidine triad protein [Streptococcus sp. S784/96/1]